jgi:hypothetical protein
MPIEVTSNSYEYKLKAAGLTEPLSTYLSDPNDPDRLAAGFVGLKTNPLTGGRMLVGPDGRALLAENASASRGINTRSLDILDIFQSTERRPTALPSYAAGVGPDVVHPSCQFFPRGWNGWRYWMAFTPYPGANSDYENPSIAVSNDGEEWVLPLGLTNPLVGKPAGGYNADTHLAMSPDGGTMYLIYRERLAGSVNNLRVMETNNGVDWTAPVTIMTGTIKVQDFASPSLFFDKTANRWVCISHNLDGGATYPMQRFVTSGTSIYSGWGAASSITITNPTSGRTFWHSSFDLLPNGKVIGIIQDIVNGVAGAPGALFAAESLDGGLTFAVRLMYPNLNYYRPSFNVVTNDLGHTGLIVWIGIQQGGFFVTREDWVPGNAAKQIADGMTQAAVLGTYPPSWVFWDNFNRADGALGTPLVGSALAVDTGTVTIVSNAAQSGSAGNNRALTTLTTADHVIEADLVTAPSAAWVIFRAVDTANFYRLGLAAGFGGPLTIQSIVGGVYGALNRVVATPVAVSATLSGRTRIRVVCRGRRFRIFVNGVLWEEIADNIYFATGLKAGFQATNAGVVFDNLLITS